MGKFGGNDGAAKLLPTSGVMLFCEPECSASCDTVASRMSELEKSSDSEDAHCNVKSS